MLLLENGYDRAFDHQMVKYENLNKCRVKWCGQEAYKVLIKYGLQMLNEPLLQTFV